jgi:hypothetical protein
MDDTIDLLQIKIENAKKKLSEDTLKAIAAVPWQAEIIKMRETRGFTFEQLGNLEIETELVLCGLLNPRDYPRELENRMKISKGVANELVEEMNKLVFTKIKEELIKNTERKNYPPRPLGTPQEGNRDTEEENVQIFKEHGIEIINGDEKEKKETLPVPEKLELSTPAKATPQEGNNTIHPILAQKMSGPVQTQMVKTEHTLENITKAKIPATDPYREIPE